MRTANRKGAMGIGRKGGWDKEVEKTVNEEVENPGEGSVCAGRRGPIKHGRVNQNGENSYETLYTVSCFNQPINESLDRQRCDSTYVGNFPLSPVFLIKLPEKSL